MAKYSLLLVENEPIVCIGTAHILKRCGYEVVCSPGGYDALDKLKRTQFDLILTDHRMPDGGGDLLVNKVRETGSNIPIVVLSGVERAVLEEIYGSKVQAILEKPFDERRFQNTIANLLDKKTGDNICAD